jgi:hypothetical protein
MSSVFIRMHQHVMNTNECHRCLRQPPAETAPSVLGSTGNPTPLRYCLVPGIPVPCGTASYRESQSAAVLPRTYREYSLGAPQAQQGRFQAQRPRARALLRFEECAVGLCECGVGQGYRERNS